MRSEDLAVNAGFPMTTATRLAYNLSELRSHAEYVAYCEEQKEYPDEVLIQTGEVIFELLAQLIKDLEEFKLKDEVQKARLRQSGPMSVVKKVEEN